ncbi:bestrophin-like domain [Paraburkholderia terrae]
MATFIDHPAVLFIALVALFIAAVAFGAFVLKRLFVLQEGEREDFNLIQTSTLTLLALLIGFSLSMAVGRYDQRKSLEEGEANAIGTEYARADLADPATAMQIKAALVRYTTLRLADFLTRDPQELVRLGRETADTQAELWRLATEVAKDKPNPIGALVVAGMNDTLNSQDYSEAARINHIPVGAWILMIVIALFGCVVQGYGVKGELRRGLLITVLPVTVALSLALIADIDSPRGGIIRVQPQNLTRLMQSIGR